MGQLEIYQSATHMKEYPSEDQGLRALVTKPDIGEEDTTKSWRGPYLSEKDLKDEWDSEFVYRVVDDTSSDIARKIPLVHSIGPNKTDENGEGDDIKCENWPAEGTGY
jgi:hypothetical protein